MSGLPVQSEGGHACVHPCGAAALLGGPESFPDLRLWRRVARIIDGLARRLRCPPAKTDRAEQRGTRRWVANRRLKGTRMLKNVLRATAQSCVGRALLVAAHDSSEIDEHGIGCPEDAGPLRSSNARGYMLHQTVVAEPSGTCLGAIDAFAWTRPWELRKQDQHSRDMSDKESSKWNRGIDHTEQRLRREGFTGKIIHVEDREADIYEHLVDQRLKKRALIVRHDLGRKRMVRAASLCPAGERNSDAKPSWIPLEDMLAALPFRGSYAIEVDGRVRDRALGLTHQRRTAQVSWHFCEAVLKPPKRYRGRAFRDGLKVWLVEAKELEPPPGFEPLHWILISLEPVLNDEQARLTVGFYKTRWKVEDFTKITKSGCQLEAVHVNGLADFKRLLPIALATANQLSTIVAAAREEPARPAREVLDTKCLSEVRDTCEYHRVAWPRGHVTLRELLQCVAQVGGYEPRRDRDPGWLVLCRGWARITEYSATIRHHELHRKARRRRFASDRKPAD